MLFEPVRSDLPSLVVTGRFDQITPPAYGERVAESLPEATLVEMAGTGHAPLFTSGECGITLLFAFLKEPSAPVDPACARTSTLTFATS